MFTALALLIAAPTAASAAPDLQPASAPLLAEASFVPAIAMGALADTIAGHIEQVDSEMEEAQAELSEIIEEMTEGEDPVLPPLRGWIAEFGENDDVASLLEAYPDVKKRAEDFIRGAVRSNRRIFNSRDASEASRREAYDRHYYWIARGNQFDQIESRMTKLARLSSARKDLEGMLETAEDMGL